MAVGEEEALTHAHAEDRRLEGLDRHQVGRDDRHGVVVNGELEVRVDGRVDEADAVRLVLVHGDIEAVARLRVAAILAKDVDAVDQAVGQLGRSVGLGVGPQLVDGGVIPVAENNQAKILVVVGRGGSVNDDAAKEALPGLQSKVGVVPGRAVLRRPPLVGDGGARRCGALRDGRDAVVLVVVPLPEAVEMHAGAVGGGLERVGQVDHNIITWNKPVSSDAGPRDAEQYPPCRKTIDRRAAERGEGEGRHVPQSATMVGPGMLPLMAMA